MLKNETIHYKGRYLGMKECDRWEYAFRTNASGVVVIVPVTDTLSVVEIRVTEPPAQPAVSSIVAAPPVVVIVPVVRAPLVVIATAPPALSSSPVVSISAASRQCGSIVLARTRHWHRSVT